MTWTAAAGGAWIFEDSGGVAGSTVPITTVTTGNLILLEVFNYTNSTVWCTGLSSSNATWAQVGVKISGTTNAYSAAVFAGTVTSVSTTTITLSWSGTAPAGWEATGLEFHSSVGSWSFDVQGNIDSAGTTTGPSLTPSSSGELYFNFNNTISSLVTGSTSGYVYHTNTDGDGNTYNLSCAAGTPTAPVWGTATLMFGIAVLMKEGASGTPAGLASGTGAALNAAVYNGMVTVGPKYAGTAADLGGVYGSWGTPQFATGGP